MTDEQLQEVWQELNNAAMRKGGDRRPIYIQFARALLNEKKPCLHTLLYSTAGGMACEHCGGQFEFHAK